MEITTILNLPDIVHFISNTIKDITALEYFKPVILIIRAVIRKFHQSHLGMTEFNLAGTELDIGQGLEAIGKTRFGTIIIAARSTERNLPTIKRAVHRGLFDLEVSRACDNLFNLLKSL